ncbi:MAG TPA: exodeoxyribonuclease VII small subunit [Nocardioidaceae bacterium]|nr:exodeoxyribonuclease VII small subunit [Nocardioidaceae bacterium]
MTDRHQSDDIQPGDQDLSYEEAREELIDVVRRLETGGTSLEDSLALWERGEKLAQVCQSWLDGAKKRLDAAIAAGASDADR